MKLGSSRPAAYTTHNTSASSEAWFDTAPPLQDLTVASFKELTPVQVSVPDVVGLNGVGEEALVVVVEHVGTV